MGGGTQRRALFRKQSEDIKILNTSFPRAEIRPTTFRIYSYTLVALPHTPHYMCITLLLDPRHGGKRN